MSSWNWAPNTCASSKPPSSRKLPVISKARCATCHPAPYYTDNSMHDLQLEQFYKGRAQGWAKTFPLRGIKDSPPYFHDGRLPTLEDVVEFFNVVLQTQLTADEKRDLVLFLQAL